MASISRSKLFKGVPLFVFCLSGTIAHSEVIEYSCTGDPKFNFQPLYFDTENKKVRYGHWPWSNESVWGEEFVQWTSMNHDGTVGAFSFRRGTAELIVRVVYEEMWRYLEHSPSFSDDVKAERCVRGF
jgi:hypothetical protein